MLQSNHIHKAKKISKEQSKEDIKKPFLGHQRKGMKVFSMGIVIHVMNMVTKLLNLDIVSDNSCHGLKSIQVYKLHEMLKLSTGESLFFQVAGQASGQNVIDSVQGLFLRSRSTVDG